MPGHPDDADSRESPIGSMVDVTIEIPRWSFVKYSLQEDVGQVEFISPLPCPFNYGFVQGSVGGDDMPLDAIVMGPRIRRRQTVGVQVRHVIHFVDNDERDDKLVCSTKPLRRWETALLKYGFPVYVVMKRTVNWWKGKSGRTYVRSVSTK